MRPNIKQQLLTLCCAFIFVLALVFTINAKKAALANNVKSFVATPDGFGQFLVFMAAGTYDKDDQNFDLPDGTFFHEEIMGRTQDEIDQKEVAAKEFFNNRFGIDVDDPENVERVVFMPFMMDPRNEYRAYVISGMWVPPQGFVVHDGGFLALLIDPDGFTLGGEFDGEVSPFGTLFVFGDYKIDLSTSKLSQRLGRDNIIIPYKSGFPVVVEVDRSLFDQRLMFQCELDSDEFGSGIAQGISGGLTLDNGMFKANIRTVLTFPSFGKAE